MFSLSLSFTEFPLCITGVSIFMEISVICVIDSASTRSIQNNKRVILNVHVKNALLPISQKKFLSPLQLTEESAWRDMKEKWREHFKCRGE